MPAVPPLEPSLTTTSLHWITVEVVEQLRNSEGGPESNDELPEAVGIRNKLWLLFEHPESSFDHTESSPESSLEHPESSRAAFVVGIISVILNILVLRAPQHFVFF